MATCDVLGVDCRVVPALSDVIGGKVALADVVPVAEVDLLGRDHLSDSLMLEVADYLHGRRVLVTGAGGSIGSELCRQLRAFEPAALIMLDRDESGLHSTQLSIDGTSQLDDPGLVVADIRDRERVYDIFDEWKPEVVFHTAALETSSPCSNASRTKPSRPTSSAPSTCSMPRSTTRSSAS